MKNRTEIMNDGLTADWLRDNGITVRVFNTADAKLLQARSEERRVGKECRL